MSKLFIMLDRENCIGCGACAITDSGNWIMGEDGKSALIKGKDNKKCFEQKYLKKNKEIAECCPVNVIHIYDGDQKLL
ncbi:MAG: ferredoxin [Candidatus Nanoarchaeia archaeon]